MNCDDNLVWLMREYIRMNGIKALMELVMQAINEVGD